MPEIDQSLQDSAGRGSYAALAALLVWALIAVLKRDDVPIPLPPRARPFVALALGQVYGVLEAVVGGMPWRAAVLRGLVVAVSAIGLHEVVSKARPAGEPSSTPKPPPLPLLALTLALAGCAGQKAQLESALEATRDIAAVAHPCLVAQQEQLVEQCQDEACKAKVRESFEPIADAFEVLHELWCGLSPESEGCK